MNRRRFLGLLLWLPLVGKFFESIVERPTLNIEEVSPPAPCELSPLIGEPVGAYVWNGYGRVWYGSDIYAEEIKWVAL